MSTAGTEGDMNISALAVMRAHTYCTLSHGYYLNILETSSPPSVAKSRELLFHRRIRAEFIEADDGEVAVELMTQAMNAGSSFDFVLMDNIMVANLRINPPVSFPCPLLTTYINIAINVLK